MFEAAAQAGDGSGRGGARSGGQAGGESLANLDFLRQNPHFQQLRQLVQQQPHMLEPILQQVAAGNPQIAQIIGQNSEQFLQLLSEEGDEEDAALPPGTQAISVTEEERDAIERVSRVGREIENALSLFICTNLTAHSSSAVSVSPATPSSRLTSPVTRTKSWQRTSSLTNPTRTKNKRLSESSRIVSYRSAPHRTAPHRIESNPVILLPTSRLISFALFTF